MMKKSLKSKKTKKGEGKPKDNNKDNINEDLVFTRHAIDDSIVDDFSDKKVKKPRITEKEMEQDLLDIYSDDGDLPDFKTIKIKKKTPWWLRIFYYLLTIAILGGLAFFVFNYIQGNRDVSAALDIQIKAPNRVILGEEFFYEISYQNLSNSTLTNVTIDVNYPENFIVDEVYSIDFYEDNRLWRVDELGPKLGGKIKVKGRIINREGFNNLMSIKSSYGIRGLSSEFSRDSFFTISVGSSPFKINEDYFFTVLVGEEYPMEINIKDFPHRQIPSFQLFFEDSDNITLSYNKNDNKELEESGAFKKLSNNVFEVITEDRDDFSFKFKYKASDRKEDLDFISWGLKYVDDNGKEFVFYEKKSQLELIKSDLHLSLLVNDMSSDEPVSFGDTLEYSIKYSNKGDKRMKDLVIMAVLDSDFINFTSIKDSNGGNVSRRTITWTYREIPNLKDLDPGQGGEIRFTVNVANFKRFDFGQKLEVKSYAQFSIGNIEDFSSDDDRLSDNRSNIIVNPINSDLSISERVLYFDDDNIPVGSGPLPPVVGEKTSFRYYWTLKNTLHEIRDLKIELDLPSYVIWEDSYRLSAGNLRFDPDENKVIFNISRWPLGISEVEINFNVSVIPTEAEYNRIMILSSGSSLEAVDIVTGAKIYKKTDVKTSKLEDDDIATFSNDGRVR